MNLRDIILAAPDLKREAVEVPEWIDAEGKPITIWISMMSGAMRSAWADEAFDGDGNTLTKNMRSRLLVHCLVDEGGAPIFTDADVEALEGKSAEVLTRLFVKAKQINGLNAGAVEDAEKNSPGGGVSTSK